MLPFLRWEVNEQKKAAYARILGCAWQKSLYPCTTRTLDVEGTDSNCLKDLPGINNLIYKKEFEFGIAEINKKLGIFERLFTIFEKKM